MANKKYHIAQFGTYDIESLGDTTFPKVLAYGLAKQLNCEIELFSMTECAEPYNGNSHVYSFEQFAQRHMQYPFDAVIIGGGEFLHFRSMDVIIGKEQAAYPEGYIWKRPLELAKQHRVPAFLNLVGVPYDMSQAQQKELCSSLQNVCYVSVRDTFSEKRLRCAGVENVFCAADNLWYMNEMYPKAELDALRHEIEKQTGRDLSSPYVLVQYGTTRNAKALAEQLQKIKAETGYRICLMPVNYCHEDRVGMALLAREGNGEFEVIDDYFQPPEMMAVISGAAAFFGTSLHGNLTAASYGVPFVGIDMYASFVSKMDGIFTMIGCEPYLVPHESAVKAAFDARHRDSGRTADILEKIRDCQAELDLHFQRVAEFLKGDR
jgi:polysaccharide pyruvyl transferase WcaK-like protein